MLAVVMVALMLSLFLLLTLVVFFLSSKVLVLVLRGFAEADFDRVNAFKLRCVLYCCW